MSVSKISDFKTLFVDLRPGSVYNQEKIRGVYKDYYDLPLSKTMVGGKRLTIEELVQGSESNEVTITGEHVAEYTGLRYRVKRASDLNGERRFVVLEVEALGAIA